MVRRMGNRAILRERFGCTSLRQGGEPGGLLPGIQAEPRQFWQTMMLLSCLALGAAVLFGIF